MARPDPPGTPERPNSAGTGERAGEETDDLAVPFDVTIAEGAAAIEQTTFAEDALFAGAVGEESLTAEHDRIEPGGDDPSDAKIQDAETRDERTDAEDADAMGEARGMSHLVRSSSIVGTGTLLSRLSGLARTAAIAVVLGGATLADGYNLANTTPNMIYDLLIGGVFTATLVPVFVEHHVKRDREGTNAVVTVLVTALIAMTVLAVILAPWIFRLYTWNIDDPAVRQANIDIGVPLLRWFLPQILFYGLTALGSAILNARRSYTAPAFVPVLNNVVVLAMLGVFWRLGGSAPTAKQVQSDWVLMTLLGAGTTAGIVVMALALWPSLRKAGVHLRPSFAWRHHSIRQVFSLSGWTLAYTLANQVALTIVLALAASVSGAGNVTAYTYAFMFFQLPVGLFAVSLMITVEPEMARSDALGDREELRRNFSVGLRLLILVLVPSAVGTVLLAHPVVNALLGHGAFGGTAELTGTLLALFGLGLLGHTVYLFALRSFYAQKNTRTPFGVNMIKNGFHIVFAFVLVGRWGVEGLVVSFSIAYSVAALGALWAVRRRIGHFHGREVLITTSRVAAAAAVMGVVVWAVVQAMGTAPGFGSLPTLLVGGVAGTVVFAGLVVVLRVPEANEVVARLRRRGG